MECPENFLLRLTCSLLVLVVLIVVPLVHILTLEGVHRIFLTILRIQAPDPGTIMIKVVECLRVQTIVTRHLPRIHLTITDQCPGVQGTILRVFRPALKNTDQN